MTNSNSLTKQIIFGALFSFPLHLVLGALTAGVLYASVLYETSVPSERASSLEALIIVGLISFTPLVVCGWPLMAVLGGLIGGLIGQRRASGRDLPLWFSVLVGLLVYAVPVIILLVLLGQAYLTSGLVLMPYALVAGGVTAVACHVKGGKAT